MLLAVIIFGMGIWLGQSINSEQQEENLSRSVIAPSQIAVVNADVGALIDDTRINYSAAIVETLGDGFVLVSPAMAQNGLLSGSYSAIVTFPSHVSERIISYNTGYPEQIQLDFLVNPNLSETDYIETYIAILDLQMAINTTLSQTYVTSIIDQFHNAQDQINTVFYNNQTNMEALEVVQLEDFTPSLQLDYLPEIILEPVEADTSHHLQSAEDFATRVSYLYLGSYGEASRDFMEMRAGLVQLVDDFEANKSNWHNDIDLWISSMQDYSGLLDEYSEKLERYKECLISWWSDETSVWISEFEQFQGDLMQWHKDLDDWFVLAVELHEKTREFRDNIQETRLEAEKRFDEVLGDLTNWRDDLEEWGDNISAGGFIINHALQHPQSGDYIDDEEGYYEAIIAWEEILNNHISASPELYTDPDIFISAPPNFDNSDWFVDGELWFPIWENADNPISYSFDGPQSDMRVELPDKLSEPVTFSQLIPPEPFGIDDFPQVEGFWDMDLYKQLNAFDVEAYLSDSVQQEVAVLLNTFSSVLDNAREDLGYQFQTNVFLMNDVYFEYSEYLRNLRTDALDYEATEKERLTSTLSEFSDVVTRHSNDTSERLNAFSSMLPHSRTTAGINRDFVSFTVAPFELSPPAMRTVYIRETPQALIQINRVYLLIGASVMLIVSGMYAIMKELRNNKERGR